MMQEEERLACLALALVPGLGPTRVHRLLGEVGSAGGVFRLTRAQLRRRRLPQEAQIYIASGRALGEAEKTLRLCRRRGIRVISLFDEAYPPLLKEIYDPPLCLYCCGEPDCLQRPSLALVGSRRCSVYGREVTRKLARELAGAGLTVVSGLARGIDSRAHAGALEGKGWTCAVMGCGVDVVYPRENRRLYERILDSGCILSEFPCGSFPAPQNFPIRNRIISGLCHGTIITEASRFSGSLITARLTLEQNRELWAVPGNITNPGSYGPNHLIRQGARPVLCSQDVLDELPVYVLDRLAPSPPRGEEPPGLGPVQRQVLKLLAPDSSLHIDELGRRSGLETTALNQALLALEMRGLIRQLPGRRYSRKLL